MPVNVNRRFFLKTTSPLLLAPWLGGWPAGDGAADYGSHLDRLLAELLIENDRQVHSLLPQQVQAPGERPHGGLTDRYGIPSAGGTAMFIQRLASAYVAADSLYAREPALMQAMRAAADFLLRIQHADGTIDLHTTNFHSPPDTAFVVEPLCVAYSVLKKHEPEGSQALRQQLEAFLGQAAAALRTGGIHTPNHRWVVCMALARIQQHVPHPGNPARVAQWLAEQIDIDPDGQYTEKSNLVYTPLTNRCLITVARLLDRPELYEPVRRNLDMMLYYLHPNGEVVSEASGRQDQYRAGTMENYYYPYRYMALREGHGQFAQLSRDIPLQAGAAKLTRYLGYFQEDEFLHRPLPPAEPLPTHYRRLFSHSQLARIRRGAYDASILARNPVFFTFQHGQAVLQGVRLHAAFFGSKGLFSPQELQQVGEGFELRQTAVGPYYQPLPPDLLPGDGNWHRMPREQRPQSEVQQLHYRVHIRELSPGFELEIELQGTGHVPLALELGFRMGGNLEGVSTVQDVPHAYLLQGEGGSYTYGRDRITFGPGHAAHRWTQLRGAPPKMDAMSVYLTGYTPFRLQLQVRPG
ncbi:MAG: hypothetical protein D6730_18010 [Bacteroidetes bacterium]|nr:MAG: hypothetical protein D6730_18010 [Bacteroidota bacterium]